MVKKGDVLIKLSNTSLILEISNYEALVSRTTNELRQARLMMEQQTLNSRSQILDLKLTNISFQKFQKIFPASVISRDGCIKG